MLVKKSLMIILFLALLIKVGYSVFMMIDGDSTGIKQGALLAVRDVFDIIMWLMLALWFLFQYLYSNESVRTRTLNLVSNLTIVVVMIKALASIIFLFYFIDVLPHKIDAWTVFFTIVEFIFWLGIFIYMARIWFNALREVMPNSQSKHGAKQYYTFEDELRRRLGE